MHGLETILIINAAAQKRYNLKRFWDHRRPFDTDKARDELRDAETFRRLRLGIRD